MKIELTTAQIDSINALITLRMADLCIDMVSDKISFDEYNGCKEHYDGIRKALTHTETEEATYHQ